MRLILSWLWPSLLLAGVARGEPLPPGTPAPLACLERYYGVAVEQDGGQYFARLADGRRIPWDDGKAKSFEEKLEAPDVEDAFSQRYRPGAIAPIERVDDDPGRIRLVPLFESAYPTGAKDIVSIDFLGQRLRVHRKLAERFGRVAARLAQAQAKDPTLRPFLERLGGTFVRRNIAGTNRPSAHSYGVSIDINAERTEYWRWQRPASPLRWRNRTPQAIVDAFEAEGFIWGGRWYHYDTMHFEYRPELLDASCYPSTKLGTVLKKPSSLPQESGGTWVI